MKYASKTSYSNEGEVYCQKCDHVLDRRCRCQGCGDIREKEREYLRQEKLNYLQEELKRLSPGGGKFEDLSNKEKIIMGCLLRAGLQEDLESIIPLNMQLKPLTPHFSYSIEILNALREKGFISVPSEINLDKLEVFFDGDKQEIEFEPSDVYFELSLSSDELTKEEIVNSLIHLEIDLESEEQLELWREIALNEIYEYMTDSVTSIFRTRYRKGDKAKMVFSELLKKHSVGQVFNIIYGRINYALRLKSEQGLMAGHAVNSILNLCTNYSERAINNDWELKNYNRPKMLPESELSKFFFESILRIGDEGFNSVPRELE
jgi:hypothetical protein